MIDVTQEWREREQGKDYKLKLNLSNTADTNERMYAGDQWRGVAANGLPTPVFNIFKLVINHFIAAIMSQATKLQYSPDNISEDSDNPEDMPIKEAAEIITGHSEVLWEELKMDMNLRQALLDAALSGDAAGYMWWDYTKETGQILEGNIKVEGGLEFELPDNVNVYFGNPNDKRVEKQPYIIIEFRELVANLRREAKANGLSDSEINMITADSDNQEQSGDRGKIELDNTKDENGKTTALLKLWRDPETKIIYRTKSTKSVKIIDKKQTKLTRYPISWMSWDTRKNSYHGQALGTGLKPNQIFINKMFAMVMVSLMNTALPKVVYDSTIIENGWSNQIGEAIPVNGTDDIRKVAAYLNPGEISTQVMNVIDLTIKYTKDMIGATDAMLGNVKPENTSAFIATSQQAAIPLENIKANLWQWVEDIGYIWLDFMANYYGKRKVPVMKDGKRQILEFNFDTLKNMRLKLKVDVGPSSHWSEITAIQTLDNLLNGDRITFLQYLDRVPSGTIPKLQELIKDIEAQDQDKQLMQLVIDQFTQTLPPEMQMSLSQMKPEEADMQIKQIMMQQMQQEMMQQQNMMSLEGAM